jgi:hypothetical protein
MAPLLNFGGSVLTAARNGQRAHQETQGVDDAERRDALSRSIHPSRASHLKISTQRSPANGTPPRTQICFRRKCGRLPPNPFGGNAVSAGASGSGVRDCGFQPVQAVVVVPRGGLASLVRHRRLGHHCQTPTPILHESGSRIDTRALRGHGCKKCASAQLSISRRRPRPGCSMADVKPELLVLWHPTKNVDLEPTDLKPNSHTRVWWLCPDCGHEWQATPGRPCCRRCGTKRSAANKRSRPKGG